MIFWISAAIALAIAAFITLLPLFRPHSYWTPIALALLFLLPTSALMLYPYVGTPVALDPVSEPARVSHTNEDPDIESMVTSLQAKLTQNPENLEGWLLLSKTLMSMQRYPQALEALETAIKLAPEDPYITVELVEARIYISGQGRIDSDMVNMLEGAVARDPSQQKGLWLLGIAASQVGDYQGAIEYWQTLQQQLEPGGPSAVRVQEQITQTQKQLGAVPAVGPDLAPGTYQENSAPEVSNGQDGIKLHLSASDELLASMPSNSVLFIIIRSAGNQPGPPLGVRRINNPALPLELTISDKDSMMVDRKISSEAELKFQARLSLTGAPTARSGDWQSDPVTVTQNTTQAVQLVMDHRVE